MRLVQLLILTLLTVSLLNASGFYLEKKSAVKIIWDPQAIQYPETFTDPSQIKAKPVEDRQIKSSVGIILKFLQKYPDDLLKQSLSSINLLGDLSYQNTPYKGLRFNKKLYVIYDSLQKSYDYRTLESALHYHYSHLLFEAFRDKFDLHAWNELNPKDFQYQPDHQNLYTLHHIPQNNGKVPYSGEFLYSSSAHSLEEDFAGIAKNLFLSDPYFWVIVKENPILQKKTNLILAFFKAIHPKLTQSYFLDVSAY